MSTRRRSRRQVSEGLRQRVERCKAGIRRVGLPWPGVIGTPDAEGPADRLKELSLTDLAAAVRAANQQVRVAREEVDALVRSLDPIMAPSGEDLLYLANFASTLRDLGLPDMATSLIQAVYTVFPMTPELRAGIEAEFARSPGGRVQFVATFGVQYL